MEVWDYQVSEIWKSQYIIKEGIALIFGSHKEKLGVNDCQTSTNGSPDHEQ